MTCGTMRGKSTVTNAKRGNCHALIVYSKLDDVWNQSDTTQCSKRSTFRQIQLELYWSVMVEFNV